MLAIWRAWKSSKHCSGVNDMAEQRGKALVPQIRFAGFTDPWEQRKLDEVASKRIEKNTNEIKETFTNSAEHGIVSQLDYFDHDITNDANIGNYSVVYPDDFVYNPRISTIAPCGPINRNKLGRNGVMSPLYTVFSVDDVINKLYLEYYFKTNSWHQFMFLEGNSGARSDRFSISDSTFFEMPIQCPVLEEQELIASFFNRLDSLITLHQRKYDKLCVLKKSMLDKMFPKGGSLYPQIRFAGFTDPWEQRKLGELSNEFKSGEFICADNVSVSGPYPVYGGNGLRGYTTTFNHEGLYTLIGRQGALCGNVNIADGKSYFTEHAVAVKANHLNDTTFLYYLFGTLDLGQYSGQSAQPGLAVSNLVEVEAMVPDKAEQKKISRVFKTVDSLITLHQRKLELLRNIKKSMLDKMFV
ncbi:restriction endonuclease subunit S [Bifidobacterium pseudocatenulatum]|nr:restriction endonuclease subunit S [Bifidobacterium pseudocatenulatum]MZM23521.1 restriction endonuclease subunit S [Bifidobacterium pseudocatenulatum]MZT84738.1 restriction endonuclease subunit S [Bifidobacterium pseudocatenulatum]